jgi:hypothetical protein
MTAPCFNCPVSAFHQGGDPSNPGQVFNRASQRYGVSIDCHLEMAIRKDMSCFTFQLDLDEAQTNPLNISPYGISFIASKRKQALQL